VCAICCICGDDDDVVLYYIQLLLPCHCNFLLFSVLLSLCVRLRLLSVVHVSLEVYVLLKKGKFSALVSVFE